MSNTSNPKTDNSRVREKIGLRLEAIAGCGDTVRVLDCFSGEGVLWNEIQKRSDKKITTTRIDRRRDLQGAYMHGDNVKYLQVMNLAVFDVIDLDAYGNPIEQLEIIARRGYSGVVIVTAIATSFASAQTTLLRKAGFTPAMWHKCYTLVSRKAMDILFGWLCDLGVKTVRLIHCADTGSEKHYFWFRLDSGEQSTAIFGV